MAENKFVPGMLAKAPRDGAPSFVKGSISVKIHEFRKFLDGLDPDQEWLNIDIKESQGGKYYAAINDWKRDGQRDGAGYYQSHRSPAQQYEEVRDQRLRDLQRSTPLDEFSDSDIPF